MNWNHAQHVIGDMRTEEELRDVRVRLADGSIAPVELTRDDDGQWILIVADAAAPTNETPVPSGHEPRLMSRDRIYTHVGCSCGLMFKGSNPDDEWAAHVATVLARRS